MTNFGAALPFLPVSCSTSTNNVAARWTEMRGIIDGAMETVYSFPYRDSRRSMSSTVLLDELAAKIH